MNMLKTLQTLLAKLLLAEKKPPTRLDRKVGDERGVFFLSRRVHLAFRNPTNFDDIILINVRKSLLLLLLSYIPACPFPPMPCVERTSIRP